MTSNHHTVQLLESKLIEYYGLDITALRVHAVERGCDITIQPDGIWLSRPGLEEACYISLPNRGEDWRYTHAEKGSFVDYDEVARWTWGYPFRDITLAAEWLWEQSTPPEPLQLPEA